MTTMTKISLACAVLGLAAPALADTKAAAPAANAAPQLPKPDPALDSFKGMIGTWACTGTGKMADHQMDLAGTAKFSWDLNNFWVAFSFEGKAGGPMQHKELGYFGYDTAKKQYTFTSIDNMGGMSMMTSPGGKDKEEWAGMGKMMGGEYQMKQTVTKVGDKEVKIEFTATGPMGTMQGEHDCKKQ
jgi:hypothetical protein